MPDAKGFVRELFDRVAAKDLNGVAAMFSADAVFEDAADPAPVVGRSAIAEVIREMWEGMPDFRVERVRTMVGCGSTVMAELDLVGTHRGPYLGCEPTGRTIRWPTAVLYELDAEAKSCTSHAIGDRLPNRSRRRIVSLEPENRVDLAHRIGRIVKHGRVVGIAFCEHHLRAVVVVAHNLVESHHNRSSLRGIEHGPHQPLLRYCDVHVGPRDAHAIGELERRPTFSNNRLVGRNLGGDGLPRGSSGSPRARSPVRGVSDVGVPRHVPSGGSVAQIPEEGSTD